MNIPVEFADIRPFEPEELPQVYERLLADEQFRTVLAHIMPDVPFEKLSRTIRSCSNNLEFQLRLCYGFLKNLVQKCTDGLTADASALDKSGRYTFISNHRDIIIDPSFLSVSLIDAGFDTTCEVAIGDNLLALPWVKDLVRVNKSFIVKRGLSPRETLRASKVISDYMHFVMEMKHDNIWIAQREGRAKDSDDRTQPAILKMIALGGDRGSVIEKLLQMHIVPLAISYEFDPCDFLKAKEFQQKRDIEGWKKSAGDDIVSMQTGVMGYKGHVHYHFAPCIDDWLRTLDPEMPKTELFDAVAEHIDREIHRNYRLYPSNFIALDMLRGEQANADKYTAEEKAKFERYLAGRVAMVDLPNADEAFLRERILTMYANPAVNHAKATTV